MLFFLKMKLSILCYEALNLKLFFCPVKNLNGFFRNHMHITGHTYILMDKEVLDHIKEHLKQLQEKNQAT